MFKLSAPTAVVTVELLFIFFKSCLCFEMTNSHLQTGQEVFVFALVLLVFTHYYYYYASCLLLIVRLAHLHACGVLPYLYSNLIHYLYFDCGVHPLSPCPSARLSSLPIALI
jgi:hypothetical protein